MSRSSKAYIVDEFGRDTAMRKPHRGFTRCESGSEMWLLKCKDLEQNIRGNIDVMKPLDPEFWQESFCEAKEETEPQAETQSEMNAREAAEFTQIIRNKYIGRSWAELEDEAEEEEEKEKNKELKAIDTAREEQWLQGAYDLEEGEIFE